MAARVREILDWQTKQSVPNQCSVYIVKKRICLKILSEDEFVICAIVIGEEEQRKRRKARWWVHNINRKRLTLGEFHTLFPDLMEDDCKFFEYFRMTHDKFSALLNIVHDDLIREKTKFRNPVGPKERLAICLRFLASGMSYRSMAFCFRMGLTTIREIVHSTCEAIWKRLQPLVMPEPHEEMWMEIEKGFYNKWNFPNAVGALDGKHVVIEAPHNSGADFFSYKKCFSIVLLALVDADKKFIFVDVGSYGKNSDGSIFNSSQIGQKLKDGKLNLPSAKKLPGTNVYLPHVIIGDEAFPLGTNLMRPFSRDDVHGKEEEKIYNYRLSRARNVVENAFGILVRRFRVFERRLCLSQEHLISVVCAACCLHNYLNTDSCYWTERDLRVTVSDARSLVTMTGTDDLSGSDAIAVRSIFRDYFNSAVGTVKWQTTRVQAGKQRV